MPYIALLIFMISLIIFVLGLKQGIIVTVVGLGLTFLSMLIEKIEGR